MSGQHTYQFSAHLWRYEGPGGWCFVTLPAQMSVEIKTVHAGNSPGWGSLKVVACLHSIKWSTSIFYDTKREAYLLPIKTPVRKKTQVCEGDVLDIALTL